MTQMQVAESTRVLEAVRSRMLGTEDPKVAASPGAEVEAQQHSRRALLEDKKLLGTAMEELRSTMRALQEEGERCTVRSRSSAARFLATKSLATASQDEIEKIHGQLRRAREQLAEHTEARSRLQEELHLCATAFGEAVAVEVEAHAGMRQEVEQLTQVTEDLEGRLRTKAHDIERARASNSEAALKVSSALERWQRARSSRSSQVEAGPLGACLKVLQQLQQHAEQPPAPPSASSTASCWQPQQQQHQQMQVSISRSGQQQQGEASLQQDLQEAVHKQLWSGVDHGSGSKGTTCEAQPLDLPALRHLVSSKEEQLATLHRKIRFLSESEPYDASGGSSSRART